MLRISNPGMRLVSQGYHFDNNGKKYIRVFMSLHLIKIQIKIQRHREMHIKSIRANFPYNITDNWVEITHCYPDDCDIITYINKRCEEVWFV